MAQRKPTGPRGTPARAAAKSKKPAAAEAEVAEDAGGIGIDAGIAILTTLVLVAAIALVDMLQAKNGDSLIF